MIEILNRYFVPVTSRNEEAFEQNGSAPPEEKKERMRIYMEFYNRKLGIGDVHVYVLAPDKSGVASLSIVPAQDPAQMIPFLEGIVAKLNVQPGPPAIKPHPTSRPPATLPPDSLVLHLVSRALAGGSWREFPSENWVVLTPAEWAKLLPAGQPAAKQSWTVPPEVAVKLAEWFYPQTEEKTSQNRSKVERADFRITVTAVEGKLARARIDGKVRLLHNFYPGGPAQTQPAESELSGYIDFDSAQRRIQRIRIVTDKGQYNNTAFAASLVSMSRETLDAMR